MTINGINVSTYHAYQHSVEFNYNKVKQDSEWIRSAALPHFGSSYMDFKKFKVTLMVKGSTRDGIHADVSKILGLFTGPAVIVLDNFSHTFKAVLADFTVQERSMKRFHKLILSFTGYEYGDEVTLTPASAKKSFALTNPGTAFLSPLKLEFTPTSAISTLTLSGICKNPVTLLDEPVIIKSLASGDAVVLDGANGIFTIGGSPSNNITIKSPPAVRSGAVTVTSSANIKPTITILPIYM